MSLRTVLLGNEPRQQLRASQALLALAVYLCFAAVQHGEVLMGLIDEAASWPLTAWNLSGGLGFYLLIRSGLNLRLEADRALTVPQSVWAMVGIAWSYAITGPARGAVMLILLLVILFSIFSLTPARARWLAVTGFALLGAAMVWKVFFAAERYDLRVELLHLLFAGIVLAACAALAIRIGRLRTDLVEQREELKAALARIQELAIRDELTGLVNRRHMSALLEQERQRCVRSGRLFSVATIDIDHFKAVNDHYGHAVGDEVLRTFARQAPQALRGTDVLARWGGEEFVVLLPETALSAARIGVERLRGRIAATPMAHLSGGPIRVTVSAGLAEHIAGESVAQTVERTDRALYDAKAQGRNRTVAA
jgi:diguanylate cyclase